MNSLNRALQASALVVCVSTQSGAHPHPVEVPDTNVVANRLETPAGEVGSAFSALEVELLEEAGIFALDDALRLVPGTGVSSDGSQRGSITALRMRGAEADQTLVMIDGMRVNDANITAFNLLGSESLLGLSSVQVLRGPQSALYGGEAMGGVVTLETRVGSAEGPQEVSAEAGSFGSFRGSAQFQGELQGLRWFVGGSYEETQNDRSYNDFRQGQTALRLEQDLGAATIVGITARTWNSEFENPGERSPFALPAEDERDAWLVTGYVEHSFSHLLTTRAVLGYYSEEFDEDGAFPFGSEGEKASLDLRNEVRWNDEHQSVIGGLAEWTSFEATTPVDEDSWQAGVYLNHVWSPGGGLTLSGGGRWEKYEDWDEVFTWRTTASWTTPVRGVRLHGSYGTGYRTPSYFELYGRLDLGGFVFRGNPDLVEEESEGWDAGIEWQPCEAFLVDVTYFRNEIDNLIDFTPANVGEATTEGVEVEAVGSLLSDQLSWRAAYTWLQADDETNGRRLVRRARHAAAFDVRGRPTEALLVGVGGTYLSGALDNDFTVFPAVRTELDDQLVLRLYGRYEVNEHLALHARVENLLDEDYEEIANYPARGMGVFGGATVTW